MSTTKHKYNQRKRKMNTLHNQMKKEGYEFKKAVRNVITYRHIKTGDKIRINLDEHFDK